LHKKNLFKTAVILMVCLSFVFPSFSASARNLGAISPTLGAVGSYSVLSGAEVTNTGATTMPGDMGISPGIGPAPHYSGFPAGIVGPPGSIHDADINAADAQAANTAAFTFIDQPCDVIYGGVKDLVGENLVAGVYCAGTFELSGTLNLSGAGVWIFKSAATLITSGTANVVGGDPCNVWWRVVSSATLGTNTSFIGNILASTAISLQTGASLNGRALAQTAAVTLDSNIITGNACLTASTAAVVVPGGGGGGGGGGGTGGSSSSDDEDSAASTVLGLPNSGGATIRVETFPWKLVLLIVSLGVLSVNVFRHSRTAKN
jgi:cytoskeletal protein CcmA (bactofilin family)